MSGGAEWWWLVVVVVGVVVVVVVGECSVVWSKLEDFVPHNMLHPGVLTSRPTPVQAEK